MNRLFGHEQPAPNIAVTCDALRADILKTELQRFHRQHAIREHYDLHTAIRQSRYPRFAVCPSLNADIPQREQYAFLKACGVEAILLQSHPATTFSAFSAGHCSSDDAITFSFTVELGQARPFGNNKLNDYQNTMEAIRSLLSNQPVSGRQSKQQRFFCVTHEIIHSGQGFSLNIEEDVKNFASFSAGTEIWRDKQARYQVQHAVEYIAFPNRQVKQGERAGLMLIEVKKPG